MHIGGCVSHLWELPVRKPSHLVVHPLILPWQNLTEDVGPDNHPAGENGSRSHWGQHCQRSILITHIVPNVYVLERKVIEITHVICFTHGLSSPSWFAFHTISLLLESHATQEKEETLSWRWPIGKEKPPGQVNTLSKVLRQRTTATLAFRHCADHFYFPY